MTIGFTGTRMGATKAQLRALQDALAARYDPGAENWFHHGDAVGADSQAHAVARETGYLIAVHPCNIERQRAHCAGDIIHPPRWPLRRNCDIVQACTRLIACPYQADEQIRGGTWRTVRFARMIHRRLTLILPDGSIVEER